MTVLLGPVPCQGCQKSVVWRGKRWKSVGQRHGQHRCPTRVRCGAFMPLAQERCDRFIGHGGHHRSRYAMDNARVAQTGRAA